MLMIKDNVFWGLENIFNYCWLDVLIYDFEFIVVDKNIGRSVLFVKKVFNSIDMFDFVLRLKMGVI